MNRRGFLHFLSLAPTAALVPRLERPERVVKLPPRVEPAALVDGHTLVDPGHSHGAWGAWPFDPGHSHGVGPGWRPGA